MKFAWVHAFISQGLGVLMDGLELGLEVFIDLALGVHLFVKLVLIRDHQGYEELGGIGLALEVW